MNKININELRNKVFEIYENVWLLINTLNHIEYKGDYDYPHNDNIIFHCFGIWGSLDNETIFQFLIDMPQADIPCKITYQNGVSRKIVYLSKNDTYKVVFYCNKLGLNRRVIDVAEFVKPKNAVLFISDEKETLNKYYAQFYDTEEKYFLNLNTNFQIKIGNQWFNCELIKKADDWLLLVLDNINHTYFEIYDLLGKEVRINYINLINERMDKVK